MNSKFPIAFALLLTISIAYNKANANRNQINETTAEKVKGLEYPEAWRDENVIDILHGRNVSDPYRWLEDSDSNETKQFIQAQNDFSQPFLGDDTIWLKINEQLTSSWNYTRYGLPRHYNISAMNTGLQVCITKNNVYKQHSLDEEPTLLIDVNSFSSDGGVSLTDYQISPDGGFLAFRLSLAGSDWTEIRVRDIESGEDNPNVKNVKFSEAVWTYDNKGFFYCRFDPKMDQGSTNTEVDRNQKLYYHRINETQNEDTLILEFPEHPTWRLFCEISDDGKYLLVTVRKMPKNSMYFIDLDELGEITAKPSFTKIETNEKGFSGNYVANTGPQMVFKTSESLLTVDIYNTSLENWKVLVQENSSFILQYAWCFDHDKLIVSYLIDVKVEIRVYDFQTGRYIRTLFHDIGTIEYFQGRKNSSEIFFKFESYLTPGAIYRYDFSNPDIQPAVLRDVKLNLDGFHPDNFSVDQVFYPSDDGAMIPMFIFQKKTEQKGPKPTLLYGYGGFGVSLTPTFNHLFLHFVNNFNGILAIANVRGGGEYGVKWRLDGILLNKQNSFTDFQAAAKYLVEKNYTEPKKIAIYGISNGGLLVAACINQRPDLFGAAVAQVGLMDMLRFHKFTVGHTWSIDFGNPQNETEFENLCKFSPLHNDRAPSDTSQYPSTLILTADRDDRVSSLHSLKFAATLQHELENNPFQTNPVLMKVYENAGHGEGKPIAKIIEEETDIATFLYRNLHIDEHEQGTFDDA